MSILEQHKKMQKLVNSNTIIPGIFKEESGVKVYTQISQEKYDEMIENGEIDNIAYNTYSMGRGIFTVGENGEVINFKGVDSGLKDVDNIAVGKVNAKIYDISEMLGYDSHYGITVIKVSNLASEIRVRGASQLQNLINEKQKLDEIITSDKDRLIKLPKILEVKPFSAEFCIKAGLPKVEEITEEFIEELSQKHKTEMENTGGILGNYAFVCLDYMKKIGMPIDVKNQSWEAFFAELSKEDFDKIRHIKGLSGAIEKQDRNYELGAAFGQTTRLLENPFRIMDLSYFVDNKKSDSVQAILDYTRGQYDKDYISVYAETMAKNIAGFMNLGLAYNNWAHRQDFALSGEMCDDAYDDVSKSLSYSKSISEEDKNYKQILKNKTMYYNQIYLFASNMKVIEEAYKIAGIDVPESYKDIFIDTFIENIQDRDETLKEIISDSSRSFEDILKICGGDGAINNFKGYEDYIADFRNRLVEKSKEFVKTDSDYEISTNAIGKRTVNKEITLKDTAQKQTNLDTREYENPNIGLDTKNIED